MKNLIIIGSGAAGLTAAIYASRANLNPLVISGVLPGGLLTQTTDVENFPGFPEAINGYELMMKFEEQAKHFGAEIISDVVSGVQLTPGGPQEIRLGSGETIAAKALIIATGASPRWLGLPSEDRLKNHGVSACATCDGAFYRGMDVVVVGGGDTAMEEALFLTKFAAKVTIIHRRKEFRASRIMAARALANPKIAVKWNAVVKEVLGEKEVAGVKVADVVSGTESVIPCQGYFAALGHVPNTEVFRPAVAADQAGFIQLAPQSSATNIDGVFAAGDCADHVYRQAITAAGMGCRAAIDAERWLAGRE
ncbi:MAG: thioredoxin-disulfide reductase [Victivallales bacterium]|nr:thioredoxin-disulfide reductase [Victivallales bacterium]